MRSPSMYLLKTTLPLATANSCPTPAPARIDRSSQRHPAHPRKTPKKYPTADTELPNLQHNSPKHHFPKNTRKHTPKKKPKKQNTKKNQTLKNPPSPSNLSKHKNPSKLRKPQKINHNVAPPKLQSRRNFSKLGNGGGTVKMRERLCGGAKF